MLIFFPSGQAPADVPLGFIYVQNDSRLGGKGRIDMFKPIRNVLVYCGLGNSKPFRRLSYRRIVVYNVIGDGHRPLFDIFFQGVPPETLFTSLCKGRAD